MERFSIPYGYSSQRQAFPSYAEDRHLCTIGPTRSGKGASVIVQALLQVPHSVVVIDPKGQNAAVTARARRAMGQDVFVLNPFGMHTDKQFPGSRRLLVAPALGVGAMALFELMSAGWFAIANLVFFVVLHDLNPTDQHVSTFPDKPRPSQSRSFYTTPWQIHRRTW